MDSNPNSKSENILMNTLRIEISLFVSFIVSYILSIKTTTFSYLVRLRQIANATLDRLSIQAYYLWSNRNIFATYGLSYRSGAAEGKTAILVVVYIVVAFLVATILFPIAMNQVTSAVTTSWNAAVSTTYVILLPVLVIIALALHFLGLF